MTKKVYKQKCFSRSQLRIFRVEGEGGHKKSIYRGNCLKRGGAWTVCRFKRGLGQKEEVVFLRGGLIPQ